MERLNFISKIYSFFVFISGYVRNIFLYICISFLLVNCTVDKIIVDSPTTIETEIKDSVVIEPIKKPIVVLSISEKIIAICDSLDNKTEIEANYGKEINEVLNFTSIPLRSAYCGATVKYILEKAGIEYNVKNPEWASNNFIDKSKIVYIKGKRLDSDPFKVGYVTGYRLNKSKRINHVGILIAEKENYFYVFEGNTTNPKNRKEQGFFYKLRKNTITYIRRSY